MDLEAGDRTVNFMNVGPDQIHLAIIEVYHEGVTEGAREAFEEKRDGPSGVDSAGSSDRPGCESLPADALQSGRTYLFQCFVPDREGGKPHVTSYDMFSIVTIE